MSSAGILKRGYLFDKKVGILPMTVDRKRWYVLRLDPVQAHRVVMEYYKDEKSATKGDAPKGIIDIRDVVTVRRVPEKKQSFEILCPGIGYRLMANSESEANEWTDIIGSYICYTRDGLNINNGMKSLSLTRVQSAGGMAAHMSTPPLQRHERGRALSDSYHHSSSPHLHTSPYHPSHPSHPHTLPPHQHQHQLLQPRSIPIIPTQQPHPHGHAHPHHAPHNRSETHTMVHMSHSLPTPPDSFSSPPSFPAFHLPPGFQRQRSLETVPSIPSPSTSSDSSSMCSGSNTSFDAGGGAVFEADGLDSKSIFRVQVKETENLNITGPVDLVVNDEGLKLQAISPDQRELVFWPLGSLRRYGVNNHCFTIITGRFCATGEGRFQFYTEESRLIHAKVHSYATQKATVTGRGRSLPRRSSESSELSVSPRQAVPIHSMSLTQSLPSHILSTAGSAHQQPQPPAYDPSQDYSRLQHFHPPAGTVPAHHHHHHTGGGVYTHAVTQPISVGQQQVMSQYSTAHPQVSRPSNSAGIDIQNQSQAKFHSGAGGHSSVPASQFHSDNPLPDAMKSVSSTSSVGSSSGGESVGGSSVGGASSGTAPTSRAEDYSRSPSEMLYPISDQEDQEEEQTALSDIATSDV